MFPSLKQIASELVCLQPLAILRQYFISDKQSVDLHVFCDVSYAAICAVAYFVLNQGDTISVVFVFGKARVAPIKLQTITELELQAALLGSRISKFICREHRITLSRTLFWTDSSTVLQWIYGSANRQQIFVANRVAEILETSQPCQWQHVPGILNPADDDTRGLKVSDLRSPPVGLLDLIFLQRKKVTGR